VVVGNTAPKTVIPTSVLSKEHIKVNNPSSALNRV
jgi:hypothetical protein